MNITLNRRFHEIRKLLGLTQKEIAGKLSISQGSVTDIERCRIGVSNKVIEKLEAELDINKAWFYTGENLPFKTESNNDKYVKIQGYNTGDDTGFSSENEREQIIKRGVELSNKLGNNDDPLFNGYYEDNKLAFYLRHNDIRLDGLLSVAISDLKDIYNALKKLTSFIANVGAPDFIRDRFSPMAEFEIYKNDLDAEFDETYNQIKDVKVLKCTRIIHYEEDINHNKYLLIQMIEYVDRYDDFFSGHKDYEKSNTL